MYIQDIILKAEVKSSYVSRTNHQVILLSHFVEIVKSNFKGELKPKEEYSGVVETKLHHISIWTKFKHLVEGKGETRDLTYNYHSPISITSF